MEPISDHGEFCDFRTGGSEFNEQL
jgi:hypothetical protein